MHKSVGCEMIGCPDCRREAEMAIGGLKLSEAVEQALNNIYLEFAAERDVLRAHIKQLEEHLKNAHDMHTAWVKDANSKFATLRQELQTAQSALAAASNGESK